MNTNITEAVRLASEVRDGLRGFKAADVVICPPFISLDAVRRVLDGSSIHIGAQNMHPEAKGAFTGEISVQMLVGLCGFVVLGHSERRRIMGESNEFINLKVKAALRAGLRPILCAGESLEERQWDKAEEVVRTQLTECLSGVDSCDGLVVAYEPVWAIGTGIAATPDAAQEMMASVVMNTLTTLYGENAALQVPLLYGGSVTPANAANFAEMPAIHGALVGGASLKADQFIQVVHAIAKAKGV
jgi:triosephosphate isomerase